MLQYNNTLDIHDVMIEQQQAWLDATNNEGLDEIRSTSTTAVEVDQSMICDIQHAVSRLVAKAPQLIGIDMTFSNSTIIVLTTFR